MFRSLCLETDRAAMGDLSVYEDRGDHVAMRTPSEPGYWYGNCVILRGEGIDLPAQVALFEAAFPGADHVLLQWDVPDMDPGRLSRALEGTGLSLDRAEAMSRSGPPHPAPLPEGLIIRQVRTDADWAAVVALQTGIGLEEDRNGAEYPAFIAARFAAKRRQMEAGMGARFGIWEGPELVAEMGVVLTPSLVRYQDVGTRASHRRRGLCAALLSHVGRWAEGQRPGATQVIVADEGSAGGRVYRKAGFRRAETVLAAVKPGA